MLQRLDRGEREAILLAEEIQADLLLIDERSGRQLAKQRGINITGLLGVLIDASQLGFLDLKITLERLQKTSFRVSPNLIRDLLTESEES